jgi:hypothetical protein
MSDSPSHITQQSAKRQRTRDVDEDLTMETPPKVLGKDNKKARKSLGGQTEVVKQALVGPVRAHFGSESPDSELGHLLFKYIGVINETEADMAPVVFRIVAKSQNAITNVMGGKYNLALSHSALAFLKQVVGVIPTWFINARIGSKQGCAYLLVLERAEVTTLLKVPRGLLKLSESLGIVFTCLPEKVDHALYVHISGVTWNMNAAVIAEELKRLAGDVFKTPELIDVKIGSSAMGLVEGKIRLKDGVFSDHHPLSDLNPLLNMGEEDRHFKVGITVKGQALVMKYRQPCEHCGSRGHSHISACEGIQRLSSPNMPAYEFDTGVKGGGLEKLGKVLPTTQKPVKATESKAIEPTKASKAGKGKGKASKGGK